MKNKRIFVGLFVILALLCLGIGYAAISKTLYIGGGVQTGEVEDLADNFIIYFSKVDVDTTLAEGTTVTANVSAAAMSPSTEFEIKNMSKAGSKVVLTYTVQNDSKDLYARGPKIMFNASEVSANQKIAVGDVYLSDKPNFTITVTPNLDRGQAAPNTTHTITIVVEMTNTPVEPQSYTFAFTFVYEAAQIPYTS